MKRLLPAALLLPAAAGAQGYSLAPYAAQNRSIAEHPTLVGASFTAYSSVFGLRFGGAFGAGQGFTVSDGGALGTQSRGDAWTADADLVVDAGRIPLLGTVLGGLAPAAFVGLGAEGVRAAGGGSTYTPLWSYGGAVGYRILGGVSVETEARYRVPRSLDGAAIPGGYGRGWEYRVGLSFRFGGGRSSGGAWTPARTPTSRRLPAPGADRPRSAPSSATARRVLGTADQYLGTPYKYGGTTPAGFDCSGFVQYVFARQGVTLPRTSRQQATVGQRASASVAGLRAGDLMLFASNGSRIDHVAIYAGDNRIVHSTSSGGGVRYDDLSTSRGRWFVEHHVASRRVLADGRSLVQSLDLARQLDGRLDPPDAAPAP
jgi:hypothetical protein